MKQRGKLQPRCFFCVFSVDICRYIELMYILYGRNEKAEKIIEEVKHGRIVD